MSELKVTDRVGRLQPTHPRRKMFTLGFLSFLAVLSLTAAAFAIVQWQQASKEQDRVTVLQEQSSHSQELVQKLEKALKEADHQAVEQARREVEEARQAEDNAHKEAEAARKEERQAREELKHLRLAAAPPEPERVAPAKPADAPEARTETAKSATAFDIVTAYQGNDAFGDEKFQGKLLRVTGRVGPVRRMDDKPPSYVLTMYAVSPEEGVTAPEKPPLAFKFTLESRKQLADLTKLAADQELIVEGRCEGRTTEAGDAVLFSSARIIRILPVDR